MNEKHSSKKTKVFIIWKSNINSTFIICLFILNVKYYFYPALCPYCLDFAMPSSLLSIISVPSWWEWVAYAHGKRSN